MDSSGTFRLSKNFELNIIPGPVKASFFILKSPLKFLGLTTGFTFSLYFKAKSKSLWSCAGQPNTAPNP